MNRLSVLLFSLFKVWIGSGFFLLHKVGYSFFFSFNVCDPTEFDLSINHIYKIRKKKFWIHFGIRRVRVDPDPFIRMVGYGSVFS